MKHTNSIVSMSLVGACLLLVFALVKEATAKEEVEFPSASPSKPVTVTGDLYRPKGDGPFPAVVVLHSCGGVDSRDHDVASSLQTEGYLALVPDTFSPRSFERCERGNFKNHVMNQVHDTLGAVAYLNSLPFVKKNHIAVIGFSLGATAIVSLPPESTDQGIRAAVSFYPICRRRRGGHFFKDSKIPLLFLLAELDNWSPASVCVTKAKQYRQEGRIVEWKVYSGVHHGFDNDKFTETRTRRGRTLEYDQSADFDSWKRLLAFLDKYVRRAEAK